LIPGHFFQDILTGFFGNQPRTVDQFMASFSIKIRVNKPAWLDVILIESGQGETESTVAVANASLPQVMPELFGLAGSKG